MSVKKIIYGWLQKLLSKNAKENKVDVEEQRKINPYLPKLRSILEQVMEAKDILYKDFKPLMIDTDMPASSLLDEDDIEMALSQISEDLNFLTILTDRPEYFSSYIDTMYEETGLAVLIQEKSKGKKYPANLVLDFEQKGDLKNDLTLKESIYVPVYKKEWESADNLDISVPIGYNTVTVKGNKNKK